MHQRRLLKLLLLPSFLSGLCTLGVAVAILGYSGWSYISQNRLFYELLFGAYGFETLLWEWSNNRATWQTIFLYNPASYYIFLFGGSVVVGLFLYAALEGVRSVLNGTANALHAPSRETWVRLGLRIAGIIGWVLYLAFFVNTITPGILLFTEITIDSIGMSFVNVLTHGAGAITLLVVALHMHIVFLRLCLLRPRIFGGWAVEETAISEHDE
jgi:hypothetical protein